MALSEKYIIENPENYTTSTFFYSNLYGIDASNNVDKLDPWEQGIECLLRSDGRDRKISENSKFSIKNLDVPMNVGHVSPKITKLLNLLKSKQSYDMMKSPIEDFFKILWIPLDVLSERHFNTFHVHPTANITKSSVVSKTSGVGDIVSYKSANKLLALNNVRPYNPLTLNLYRDVNHGGKLVKTKMTWADFQQFDHTGGVMLNDATLLNNPDSYWALKDPTPDMLEMKFNFLRNKSSPNIFGMSNKDPKAQTANYSAFQVFNSLFGTTMFLRHKKSGKITNHQSLSTKYQLSYSRSIDPIVKYWNYVQNTGYDNMKKYCASDFGSSNTSNSNGHLLYLGKSRSIFDMDCFIPSRWSERGLSENETDFFKAMTALGFPMMIYNRNSFGLDTASVSYKALRKWNINRVLEDYELLIPYLFKEEIEDSH